MVTLRPMSKLRHDHWAANIWPVYRAELLQAGYSEDYAHEQSQPDPENSVEYGMMQPGNFALEVVNNDVAIGNVWLVQKGSEWWVYDIEIDEGHRGKGLGREAMNAIERFVKEHDGSKIMLSVFGFNKTAQNLYLSEGFEVTRIQMHKNL